MPFLFLPPRGRKKEKRKSEAERLVAASFASAGTSPTEGYRISGRAIPLGLRRDEPDGRLQDLRHVHPSWPCVDFIPAGPRLFSYRQFAKMPLLFIPPRGRNKEKRREEKRRAKRSAW
jgi:hypothetical protein